LMMLLKKHYSMPGIMRVGGMNRENIAICELLILSILSIL
jgi:hypothetical protein